MSDHEFKAWLQRVDALMVRKMGLTHEDLADQCWRDWAEDGMTPDEAVRIALVCEGWEGE